MGGECVKLFLTSLIIDFLIEKEYILELKYFKIAPNLFRNQKYVQNIFFPCRSSMFINFRSFFSNKNIYILTSCGPLKMVLISLQVTNYAKKTVKK